MCQITLDHQNNMKERIMSLHIVHMHTSSLAPALSNTHTHTHTQTHTHTHTHLYYPVLCQQDQYFRPKWDELREKKIHIEVWKHSRRKKTDTFKSTNTLNKSWWAWWGDCSSFWQLCNYSRYSNNFLWKQTLYMQDNYSIRYHCWSKPRVHMPQSVS